MSITLSLSEPFYFSGAGTSSADVPGRWDVGLAGVGYMVDFLLAEGLTRGTDGFQRQSVSLIRQQADTSSRPGEQSINPEDLWRRSAEQWNAGAGQNYYDRSFSTDGRFRTSTGIDPSVKGQISLLHDTALILSSTSTNLQLAVAGSDLYVTDNATLKYTTALAFPSTWNSVSGTSGALKSICSDGNRVYVCTATDIYYTARGTGTAAAFHSGPLANQTLLRYAKGRLLSAGGASLYDNGAQGSAAPSALYTQPNSDWTWVDIAEGPGAIYFAGYSGDKSLIYQTGILTDATALAAPIVAGELPDGELVKSLCGYLGFLLIGTTKGVRFASLDSSGNIGTIGDLIPTDSPVTCFEPQDRFVWFGGSTASGLASLGRVDLSVFNGTTPAYWNDLAVAGTSLPATSVATYSNVRVFATTAGVYGETTKKVPSGSIRSGYVDYNLADDKTALRINTKNGPGAGSYTVALAVDDGLPQTLGPPIVTSASSTSGRVLSMNSRGALFEVTLTLTRDDVDLTAGPVIRRWTLRSLPGATRRHTFTVPLIVHEVVKDKRENEHRMDPLATVEAIAALCDTDQVVTFQLATQTYAVNVMDYHFVPLKTSPNRKNFDGTCSVLLGVI